MQGARVWSLVEELRAQVPHSMTKNIYNNNNGNKMKAGFLKTVTDRKAPLMAVNL